MNQSSTKKMAALFLSVSGSLLLSLPVFGQATETKNILFLMADDFNYWAGSMDYHPAAKTPVLDALAEKGVLFTNAMSSSPVCNPSRNALMSGYRPATTGISNNAGGYVRDIDGFSNIVTMHQYFKENGFHAFGSGKLWHPGSMGSAHTDPTNWSGFFTDGSGCNGGTYKRYDGSQYTWSGNTAALTTGNCNDHNLAVKIANKIANYHTSADKDKPFFIGCGLFRPHAPFHSPKQFWDVLDGDLMVPGPGVEDQYKTGNTGTTFHKEVVNDGVWGDGIHSYLACLALTDHNVGIILDALDNSPMAENTIVVFMGDHGFDLGEQGRWGKFAKTKSANHTTLIIYDPSAKGNGQKCHHPVTLQDIYPTLVELSGLPIKKDIEGVSLAHLLDCPSEVNWHHPAVMTYGGGNYVMTKDWYFIEDGNNSQLFNNADDPYQWNDLFGQAAYNGVVSDLRAKIDSTVAIGTKMRNDLRTHGAVQSANYNPQQPITNTSCACEDEEAPSVPGAAQLSDASPTSISISWDASTDNIETTGYEVLVNGDVVATVATNSAVISNLICETEYSIGIIAFDACQNKSEASPAAVFSTTTCDTESPTVPSNLRLLNKSDVSFAIEWDASTDNDAVKGYEVFIDDALKATTEETSFLVDGLTCAISYSVKVRAIDFSLNASDFSNELVVETEDCGSLVVPGKIEAEDFSDKSSGIQVETIIDGVVDQSIGFIKNGDWVEYLVNVTQGGDYRFDFRVASGNAGGTVQVLADGVEMGDVSVANTGGWQSWTTVSNSMTLSEGIQTLRLNFQGGTSYLLNLNWFDIMTATGARQVQIDPDIKFLVSNVVDARKVLHLNLLYSDPAVKLEIFDVNGAIVQSDVVPGEHENWYYPINPAIKPGIYFIRINNHLFQAVEKFIVK